MYATKVAYKDKRVIQMSGKWHSLTLQKNEINFFLKTVCQGMYLIYGSVLTTIKD